MSTTTTDLEEKITQDTLLLSMPERFRKACKSSYLTHELDLSEMQITDHDLKEYLIPFLKANPNIYLLELMENHISDAGAKALAQITTLQAIDIRENSVGAIGAKAFSRVLLSGRNKTLNSLLGVHLDKETQKILNLNSEALKSSVQYSIQEPAIQSNSLGLLKRKIEALNNDLAANTTLGELSTSAANSMRFTKLNCVSSTFALATMPALEVPTTPSTMEKALDDKKPKVSTA